MSALRRVEDWRALPLAYAAAEGGRCLIEASAGTGKTWTIAVLYLRLLLEQGLSPRQIVVTTFTDAAAEELRERLRAKLRWAERHAQIPADRAAATTADEHWLQARWAADPARAAADALRLRLAQAELDLAPVGTLHGLCRRILTDFPFECGSAFRLGELVPGRTLDDELIDDLWRQLGQSAGELEPGDLAWWRQGLDTLRRTLRAVLKPGVRVRVADADEADALLQPSHAQAIRDWIGDGSRFKRSNSALLTALRKLADHLEAGDRASALPDLAEALGKPLDSQLRAEFVEAARDSEVLAFARHAARVLADPELPARSAALARYRETLLARRDERLRAHGQLTFDELIAQVHRALAERGGVLADRLFREWPVALVDEFQDTDQQQYAILDRIYRDDDGAKRGRLVMIGDPKQAIYRFRGGDIHAYLAAREDVDAELRLDRNFRSSPALVAGFNELYALAGPALSQRADAAAIAYEPVSAGRVPPTLRYRGEPVERPLALHLCTDAPAGKAARVALALDACANHVAELLGGDWAIGTQALRPGDIAVLLPTNQHVAELRERLRARGVPCVGAGRSSVFATDVARELQIVLYGIDHAGDEGAMRAALATRLLGVGLAELAALRERPEDWLRHEQRFAQWQRQWRQEGVLAVVQSLLRHAAPALLARADGERALTDLRHLGELLQQAEDELHGAEQLLAWLADQREGEDVGDDAAEEQQLRIESDARRVRLMTLHASKGLEFPVVLLPLMWAQEGREERLPLHYDPRTGSRELVLGGPGHAEACAEAAEEDQDERFRVLYVALTRAEQACHVYALDPARPANGQGKPPPRDPRRSALDATVERLLASGVAEARQLAWSSEGWPWPCPPPAAEPAPPGQPRAALVPPAPRPVRQVHSFSTLARVESAGALEDQAASDEAAAEPVDATADASFEPAAPVAGDPALLALAPWRGAEFGNALHAVFEHRQVGVPMAQQHPFVARCLHEAGVRRGDEPAELLVRRLAARVQATLDAPLVAGLALGALPADALRAEMAFHYVLDAASLEALREACAHHGEPALVPRSSLGVLRGLMTGKIDLVFEHAGRFHVLDYKSNWLGAQLDAYLPERLPAAMDAHHYRFQALLYTVALDRLLRQRLPDYRRETHLGEAIYLFVRAVGLAPGAGVWRQRFGDGLLDAVDAALGAPAREVA